MKYRVKLSIPHCAVFTLKECATRRGALRIAKNVRAKGFADVPPSRCGARIFRVLSAREFAARELRRIADLWAAEKRSIYESVIVERELRARADALWPDK